MANLILGSNGQLGIAFRRLLPDAVACTRQQADLENPEEVRVVIEAIKPTVVLNCTAYNAVDRAEGELARALAVNAIGVRALASVCRDVGALLVHFSTNYVFGQDDARQSPYRESDEPGPISAYGVSKLAGEYFARSMCPQHLVIRTCGLFGESGRGPATNFIERLLDRARRGETLRVVDDQVCTPTAAEDLAKATLYLIGSGARGLIHYTSAGACTWHEFASAALRRVGTNAVVEAIASEVLAAPARRPKYSVLDCGAYDCLGFAPRPTWQHALEKYFESKR